MPVLVFISIDFFVLLIRVFEIVDRVFGAVIGVGLAFPVGEESFDDLIDAVTAADAGAF